MIKFPRRMGKKERKKLQLTLLLTYGKIRTKWMIVFKNLRYVLYLSLSLGISRLKFYGKCIELGLREFRSVLKKFREFMDRLSSSRTNFHARSIFGRDTFRFALPFTT